MTTAEMQIIAAGFASQDDAAAAERELRASLDLGDADLGVEGLGGDAGRDGYAAILGGRFRAHRAAFARRVFEHHGGVVLTAVPELWLGSDPSGNLAD